MSRCWSRCRLWVTIVITITISISITIISSSSSSEQQRTRESALAHNLRHRRLVMRTSSARLQPRVSRQKQLQLRTRR
jgi:hypothetical protein